MTRACSHFSCRHHEVPFLIMIHVSNFCLNGFINIDSDADVDSTLVVSLPNRYFSDIVKVSSLIIKSLLRCGDFVVIVEEEDIDDSSVDFFTFCFYYSLLISMFHIWCIWFTWWFISLVINNTFFKHGLAEIYLIIIIDPVDDFVSKVWWSELFH